MEKIERIKLGTKSRPNLIYRKRSTYMKILLCFCNSIPRMENSPKTNNYYASSSNPIIHPNLKVNRMKIWKTAN